MPICSINLRFPRCSILNFYIEATERGPGNGGDGGAVSFPSSACCCIPLQQPLSYINKHTARVAGEGYHTNIPVNRVARRLEWIEGIAPYGEA
jgi:hypothetical protein